MGQISPDFLVQDAVIPKRALAELLQLVYDEADAAGLPAVNVFHAGDGNLHPNFLFDSGKPGETEKVEAISKRLMQRVVAVGGTLSGEHGIGNDKTAYMPLVFGEHTLRLQLAVPNVFNPLHQLNPLKVFASRRFDDGGRTASKADGHHAHEVSKLEPGNGVNAAPAALGERTFSPFFDEIDGVMSGPATMTAADLETLRVSHGFRFPLLMDRTRSIREQVASSGFAPASSRFGPYCDNIMGMNWKLPSGRIVRIGERVVKSTTGYDLLRFLLNSDGRFGEPVDFVLRLRPDSGMSGVFTMSGSDQAVSQATAALLATCWIHWFDSVDVLFDGSAETCQLRIALNCPAAEWPVYAAYLQSFAAAQQLSLVSDSATALLPDGCPDFALKTTPDQALTLAREIVRDNTTTCIALAYNGVVHGYLKQPVTDALSQINSIIQRYSPALFQNGGDWQSRHIPSAPPAGVEAEWLKVLGQEFAAV